MTTAQIAVPLFAAITSTMVCHEAVAQPFALCTRISNGDVRAIPAKEDCSDLPGNWVALNSTDDGWMGAGTGSLRTRHEKDSVIVGTPSGVNAKLTVNAGANQDVFRARANATTAFFIGANGRTGIRAAQPQAALHVGASAKESPLRVDRFGSNEPQLLVTSQGNVGINTPDPVARLHVQGGNDGTDLFVRDTVFARMRMVATNPANNVTLSIQARGGQGAERAEIGTISSHDMVLFTNGTTRISITSSGAVCIGNC